MHRLKGPGLLESIYERCLQHELGLRGVASRQQVRVPVEYKGLVFEETLRVDLLVENCLVVENKAVEAILPQHKAQLLSYLRLLDAPLGLLINWHEPALKNGISRLILHGADRPEKLRDLSDLGV